MYLVTSLHGLIRQCTSSKSSSLSQKPSAPMLATHISLSVRLSSLDPHPPSLPKVLSLAQKYTSLPGADSNAKVWIARLDAEKVLASDKTQVSKIWKEARERVKGEGVVDVWLWGLKSVESNEAQKILLGVSLSSHRSQLGVLMLFHSCRSYSMKASAFKTPLLSAKCTKPSSTITPRSLSHTLLPGPQTLNSLRSSDISSIPIFPQLTLGPTYSLSSLPLPFLLPPHQMKLSWRYITIGRNWMLSRVAWHMRGGCYARTEQQRRWV